MLRRCELYRHFTRPSAQKEYTRFFCQQYKNVEPVLPRRYFRFTSVEAPARLLPRHRHEDEEGQTLQVLGDIPTAGLSAEQKRWCLVLQSHELDEERRMCRLTQRIRGSFATGVHLHQKAVTY
jgi:hypothetical protein